MRLDLFSIAAILADKNGVIRRADVHASRKRRKINMEKNAMLSERRRFLGLDNSALAKLKGMKRTLMQALPGALEIFYAKAAAEPGVNGLFSSPAAIAHAKGQQRSHWDMISDGQFDQSYLNAVTKVGNVHAAIGLEPRWYIAGYAIIFEQLVAGVLEARLQRKTSFWQKFINPSKIKDVS